MTEIWGIKTAKRRPNSGLYYCLPGFLLFYLATVLKYWVCVSLDPSVQVIRRLSGWPAAAEVSWILAPTTETQGVPWPQSKNNLSIPTSGLQPLVYNLWSTTSGLQPLVYTLWSTTSGLQPLVCNLWSTTSGLQPLVYNLWSATSGL